MAKRLFRAYTGTGTATAQNAQATSGQYMAIQGGASTQLIDVLEVLASGLASASTIGGLTLARAATLQTGSVTALAAPNSDGGANPNISALSNVVVSFVASATNQSIPSNAATDAQLNLGFNLFGGILRWNAAPFQQWQIVGNAATTGESVLWNNSSAGGVTGAWTAHIMYEPT